MKLFFEDFKKYKFFLSQLVKKEIKLKYRSSYLGVIWTMLEPLLTMLVLTAVFTRLFARQSSDDYPVYILTGKLLFTFFSQSTTQALKSIRSHSGMIKKVYVPKYMYPMAGVLSNYIMFLISLVVLAIVALVRGVFPTIYLLQAIVPLITILVFSLGLGLCLATVAVFFRDLEYLWGVATMIIMYASAIFYQIDSVVTEKNAWIFRFNPVYAVIENFRSAVFGRPMDGFLTIYSAVLAVVTLGVGALIFNKNQDKFILHL